MYLKTHNQSIKLFILTDLYFSPLRLCLVFIQLELLSSITYFTFFRVVKELITKKQLSS